MELTWQGTTGWCDGFVIGQVYERRNGWEGCVRGDRVDDVLHPTLEAAIAAVDAAVAGHPPPKRAKPPERRRYVRNRGPEWAPHPGTVPAHKRR